MPTCKIIFVPIFTFKCFLELLTPHTLLSHMHQPHFSSNPRTNLNSTHSLTPSQGQPRSCHPLHPNHTAPPPHCLLLFSLFFLNSSSPSCSTSPIWPPLTTSPLHSTPKPTRSGCRRPPSTSISLFPSISHSFLLFLPQIYHVYVLNMFLFWFLVVLSVYFENFWYKICLAAEKMWKICRKIAFWKCYQTLEIIFWTIFHCRTKYYYL